MLVDLDVPAGDGDVGDEEEALTTARLFAMGDGELNKDFLKRLDEVVLLSLA